MSGESLVPDTERADYLSERRSPICASAISVDTRIATRQWANGPDVVSVAEFLPPIMENARYDIARG